MHGRWMALVSPQPRNPRGLDSDFADLKPLAAAIGDAWVVVLGEESHGGDEDRQIRGVARGLSSYFRSEPGGCEVGWNAAAHLWNPGAIFSNLTTT